MLWENFNNAAWICVNNYWVSNTRNSVAIENRTHVHNICLTGNYHRSMLLNYWHKAMNRCLYIFHPSPRRYSSGWALGSWIISLHFSLFFICSDDEASNDRMKKWKEWGWKRSWPTYFHSFPIHFIHPRLIIWVLNNLVFTVWGCRSHAQPHTWRTRVSLFVWLLPLDLSGMGDSTSSYATACIALGISGALKPHHHDKVETPSVGLYMYYSDWKLPFFEGLEDLTNYCLFKLH
jgi:hypothetical protein